MYITYGMLSSVGFSAVYILFVSPWLYGVKNPRFVAIQSEQLARIFQSYDIPVYHKPINTLRSLLVSSKDKTDKVAKCGVVYDIQCPDCNQHYIGETARPLST